MFLQRPLIPLLIPRRIEELREQEKAEAKRRLKLAYQRYGVEVDGRLCLPLTPEVEKFLDGEIERD